MNRPVLLAVDDDHTVLRAIEADLRAHYAKRYQVVTADSGEAALEVLRALKLRGQPVALLLADQRMPRMTGVELLEAAGPLHPDARRVLLTAYADTDAAVRAINRARISYYLQKPWDPPSERLYPVLDDLLETWRPPPLVADLRVVGHRWSRATHDLRDFLARNLVPYRWLDVEEGGDALELLALAGVDPLRLPVAVLGDGTVLVQPSAAAVAARIGLRITAQRPFYDLVVVGAGPAGLAAGVYGASEGLSTLLVERLAPGGQAGTSTRIENYLGFPNGLSGADLTARALQQAIRFATEVLTPQEATGLDLADPYRVVRFADDSEVTAGAVVVATGVAYRTLDVPGADALTGAGIYYAAGRPEALDHAGEDVYIIGGGNSAGQAAVYLSEYAASVTILVRRDGLSTTMSRYLVDRITGTPNIRIRSRTQVSEVKGGDRLEALTLTDSVSQTTDSVRAGALFVFIGMAPHTGWIADTVRCDDHGFLYTGSDLEAKPSGWALDRRPFPLETSVPGVFAAGDVRYRSVKRVASAVGEGAMAVRFVHEHLALQ